MPNDTAPAPSESSPALAPSAEGVAAPDAPVEVSPSLDGAPGSSPFARALTVEPPMVVTGAPADAPASASETTPPKRPRGRPPKNKNQGPALPTPTGDEKEKAAPPSATGSANAVRKMFVDTKQAASTISIMMDGAFRALSEKRYGAEAAKRAEPSDEEKREVAEAFELFMRSANVQLSPGANLALAIGGVYGTRAVMLEMTYRQQRKPTPSIPVIG